MRESRPVFLQLHSPAKRRHVEGEGQSPLPARGTSCAFRVILQRASFSVWAKRCRVLNADQALVLTWQTWADVVPWLCRCNKTLSFVDARPYATGGLTINKSFRSCKIQACANLLGSVKVRTPPCPSLTQGELSCQLPK